MKKLAFTLLIGTAASAYATQTDCESNCKVPEVKFVTSQHEFYPSVRYLKHEETDYTYSKILGGMEYNYAKSEGLNFNSFVGYSIYKDKSYFVADWAIRYLWNYTETVDLYPTIGIQNVSHFSTNTNDESFQIYRSALSSGLGLNWNLNDAVVIDTTVTYFKDLATSCILHKGDEFWGKNYFSPSGVKLNLNLRFLTLMKKNIELGGFYAQTIKDCYKEYGFKTSVVFAF